MQIVHRAQASLIYRGAVDDTIVGVDFSWKMDFEKQFLTFTRWIALLLPAKGQKPSVRRATHLTECLSFMRLKRERSRNRLSTFQTVKHNVLGLEECEERIRDKS